MIFIILRITGIAGLFHPRPLLFCTMEPHSRYTVGIDLGTTNCVLAYVDHQAPAPAPRLFAIPQLVAPGEIAALPALPSFIYLPEDGESSPDQLRLPWQTKASNPTSALGAWARDLAAKAPDKVVASAKSWLCSERIDRHAPCLPTTAPAQARKISPVSAAQMILEHLRDAWNNAMAGKDKTARLEKQDLVITVPASFDAVARDLTVEAAKAAGLAFTLLEEPQAAFYAWLASQGDAWRQKVTAGDVVLVCDIGGGTTDFSLIAVTDSNGDLGLQRIAVGDHTLLGGDNMDLTLAYTMAEKINREQGIRLDAHQLTGLTHACRQAKEAIGNGAAAPQPLTVLGRGAGLVGGTITTTVSAEELRHALLEGFFPACPITAKTHTAPRGGLRTFALDYAADPGFTRHLAQFLDRHSFKDNDGVPILPSLVLFNGGVTKAPLFRERLLAVLQSWKTADAAPVTVLEQPDSDLAVAQGAAWLAHVKRTGGVRIKAGSARSYYLGVESPMPAVPGFPTPMDALCVVNFGLEEGSTADVPGQGLALVIGEPTAFRFFTSTNRQQDQIGDRLQDDAMPQLTELPALNVTLPLEDDNEKSAGQLVPITLRTVLTDIGTLQVWCDETPGKRSWQLEFNLRD